jgi:DNA-binding NarL/FixJ family response regulator
VGGELVVAGGDHNCEGASRRRKGDGASHVGAGDTTSLRVDCGTVAGVLASHDGRDVLGTVARYSPDLILMDLSLPGQNGLVLTRLLKELGTRPKVVVVTMHADRVYVDEAIRAGADGYLLKTARASELRHALKEILAGHRYISPTLELERPSPRGWTTDPAQPWGRTEWGHRLY